MTDPKSKCIRCEVLEDLLETATSERDKARDEATKADREALSNKFTEFSIRADESRKSHELLHYFRNLAISLGATPSQMLERD